MAGGGRKELVYKGNRLHIFPLLFEQAQWSQHKAGEKGTGVVVSLQCHPGLGIRGDRREALPALVVVGGGWQKQAVGKG